MNQKTILITRSNVERLLDIPSCIRAVADAFQQKGLGQPAESAVLGVRVTGGSFHAKAARLDLSRPYFVAKVNANFPDNPRLRGLPTIQGVLLLFDATDGRPLAVMDSMAITILRTAAASAVAADLLSRADARTATFIGCGAQAAAHVAAISAVRNLERVFVFDIDKEKETAFAAEMRAVHSCEILTAAEFRDATRASDIVVTTTSSTSAFLGIDDVSPGTFVAAVGADNEHKQEIDPSLLRAAAIVVDNVEQCAAFGDLHHAIKAGIVDRSDVRASLDEIVAGTKSARQSDDEIIVFDSTGVAIEDVAAASIVYERARAEGAGLAIPLAD